MKRLMDELEKATKEIVIVDTNVIIHFEKSKCSKIDLKAINNVFKTGIKPFITDLSFVELIIGSRNLLDFQNHYCELNSIEFLLCGDNEELSDFLSNQNYDSFTNNYFSTFKAKIIELRDKAFFPMFLLLVDLFNKVNIILLHTIDKQYWDYAFFVYEEICLNYKKEYVDFIFEFYKTFVNDKNESKYLIKGFFVEIFVYFMTKVKPDKYNENEVRNRFNQILTPNNYSNLIKSLGINKNKNDCQWLEKGFIHKMRKIIDCNNEAPILSDGLCFIISNIIFHNANYNPHDLIDLYNIYFASKQKIRVHYFTNDAKTWPEFIDIEKSFNSDLNIFFNQ